MLEKLTMIDNAHTCWSPNSNMNDQRTDFSLQVYDKLV